MSQQIATLDLTGATTNQSGTVSWAQANIHSSQQQWVKGMRPYLELVNLSACTLAISLPRGGDNMPLPAGAWHVYPLSVEEFSYTYMVLNAQQNATGNKVYGWYYAAFEEPPKTGQVVNQSQALAAPAQGASNTTIALAGSSSNVNTIGPSTTAASFILSSLAIAFFGGGLGGGGGTMGIGRRATINISNGFINVWIVDLQEREEPYFYPLNLVIANTTPGTSKAQVSLFPAGGSNAFSVSNELAVIGYIS